MNLRTAADELIKPHEQKIDLRKRSYRTGDIMTLVQEVLETDYDDTEAFAGLFEPTIAGLKQLFDFVDANFQYVEDPDFNQWIQTPSFLWYTKRGDCKSFTVFISSVLRNMGVKHRIRYVGYGSRKYTHVYPVAILKGKQIPLDVVWKKQEGGRFGREKQYTTKKDYQVEGLYKLGTSDSTDVHEFIGQVENSLSQLEMVMADVPDSIIAEGPGDVTTFTKGELDRMIWMDRYNILADQEENPVVADRYRSAAIAMERGKITGIGNVGTDKFGQQVRDILSQAKRNNQMAFAPFQLEIPNPVPAKMKGFFKNVGKWFKKVGDTFAKLFKKFVNWIFKGVGKAMGPYFIYLFANKNRVKSPEIRRRIREQEKTFNWIAKVGRLDKTQLKNTVLNGIKEKTKLTPDQIFKQGGTPEIAGPGFLAGLVGFVIKAIGWVVRTIEKIVGLFKKNKGAAGEIGENNMSDPTLLEEEARLQKEAGGSTDDLNKGGNSAFGIAAFSAIALAISQLA